MALAKTLMIQGTASHVGKSVITAALCRIFKNRGVRVAPFKSQNMSNNSWVTADGGEIGRAQAVQAEACGIEPSVLMNPVLLKPESDASAQVVVLGRPVSSVRTLTHPRYRRLVEPAMLDSLKTLRKKYDLVILEGAGSPAEVNLRRTDLVNMRMAQAANAPVILVGNIDWGGVFAQFVGTLELLPARDRSRVKALLINQFRGDGKVLQPGVRWLERRTKRKVLGVVPYFSDLEIAEEDSLASNSSHGPALRTNRKLDLISGRTRDRRLVAAGRDELLIDVLWLPRMSNFTDFDQLARMPKVKLRFLHEPDRHQVPDLIFLPGTKSTAADLAHLRKSGMADYLLRAQRAGSWVVGICGGYQMLGQWIHDPEAVESKRKKTAGLELLPVETHFARTKETTRVQALHESSGTPVEAYEIHMGRTRSRGRSQPFFKVLRRGERPVPAEPEGVYRPGRAGEGAVFGTYLHGAFNSPAFLQHFLNNLRAARGLEALSENENNSCDLPGSGLYDTLAAKIEPYLDVDFLLKMADL